MVTYELEQNDNTNNLQNDSSNLLDHFSICIFKMSTEKTESLRLNQVLTPFVQQWYFKITKVNLLLQFFFSFFLFKLGNCSLTSFKSLRMGFFLSNFFLHFGYLYDLNFFFCNRLLSGSICYLANGYTND